MVVVGTPVVGADGASLDVVDDEILVITGELLAVLVDDGSVVVVD